MSGVAKDWGNDMKLQVSDQTLKTTIYCEKEFSCLKGNRNDLCRVERCVNEKVYFITCLNEGYCSYRHTFGPSYFCSCPTRQEIFDKYKI